MSSSFRCRDFHEVIVSATFMRSNLGDAIALLTFPICADLVAIGLTDKLLYLTLANDYLVNFGA